MGKRSIRVVKPSEATSLYFAYGSNLHREQMARRCPAARPFAPLRLPNWRLEMRGVADVVPKRGGCVHGGIYEITPACEVALDRYEGFNRARPFRGLYRKETFLIQVGGAVREVMFYRMNAGDAIYPAGEHYFGVVRQGFADWKLPPGTLYAAQERARGRTFSRWR